MSVGAGMLGKWAIGMAGLLLSSCVPQPEVPDAAEAGGAKPGFRDHADAQLSGGARQSLRFTESRHGEVRMSGVAFDARECRLRVVDQDGGPGSRFVDAAAVGRAYDAVAVVNAGFFTPEGRPLGLVVVEGRPAGAWNSASSLGSALWWEDGDGKMAIVRRSETTKARATFTRHMVQSGPLLLEHGRPVGGLDEAKASARTFLIWDGGQRWWMGTSSPVSLAGLARVLSDDPPVDWKPRMVLNLDGGRSSDLWVSASLAGREVTTRMPWNRSVRNFLVLDARR